MNFKKNTHLSTGFLQRYSMMGRLFGIVAALLFLISCSSSHRPAPISTRQLPPSTKVTNHIVSPGETLYSIAWRYGLDYRGLASVNNIGGSFRIFPGQIIYLDDQPQVKTEAPLSPVTSPVVTVSPPVVSSNNNRDGQKKIEPSVTLVTPPQNPIPSVRSEKKSTTILPSPSVLLSTGKIYWHWPASGRVLTNFYGGDTLKKGIDIAGEKGDAVLAAAAGEVVYAGSGLRGYGKLVIIKHNDTYLSAYAHNDRLRVKEGDKVSVEQRIADMGSTGTGNKGKPKLHFQIRQDGKPIDPLPLLPKRNF
jgi:lipoprotein NlpD